MKRILAVLFLLVSIGLGPLAYGADETFDCDCKKGGLGLKIGNFVVGFGVKNYNTVLGCNHNVGLVLGLGGEKGGIFFGAGYDQGVVGFGFAFRGPETTTSMGFGVGYDYGDCRMVWPYEE
ncbi:MAG TPA: hypothetical protein PLR71_09955 [Deltaproteobacteria bacterium]|nr:hypothetical protein [Deltaproteobacteria bacterium]HQI81872.1 hypothetical protein [Deltaproteobacteria bacterium]